MASMILRLALTQQCISFCTENIGIEIVNNGSDYTANFNVPMRPCCFTLGHFN